MPQALDSSPPYALTPAGQALTTGPARTNQPASGFQARLDGLELWDVVQMECLSGARRVIRIVTETQDGFLFFEGGQVVHAIAGSQTGEHAALRLLSLRNGRCAACQHPWPARATIHTPWQGLLLQAAQAMDERPRRHRPRSGVLRVEVTGTGADDDRQQQQPSPAPVAQAAKPEHAAEHAQASHPHGGAKANAGTDAQSETLEVCAYEQLAWIDAQGEVIQEEGSDGEFSGAAAYATRLAQLTGEMLGLGEFLAMECRAGEDTRFVYRDEQGGIVACQPRTAATANQLRKQLGL